MFLGIDVGTGSARAGVFDRRGNMLGAASCPLAIGRPQAGFVEQDSDDIFRACGDATRAALKQAGVSGDAIEGVGFDATCSLVALDDRDRPVTVSPTGQDRWNVIVWMDHRALAEAARIDATGHEVLRYLGGAMSPEMQTPKLLWLKEHLPDTFRRARRFLDLADFLTYRATGVDVRSLCTTVCKWTYLAHAGGWQTSYFDAIGLGELAAEGFVRIGTDVRPMGERIGPLTQEAAALLGLSTKAVVGVSMIDAHAGGIGTLGGALHGEPVDLEKRLALVGGTSTCHLALSQAPRFVPGVWGPYFSAMVPGLWLTEGGQSATGALIDHVIDGHALGEDLRTRAQHHGTTAYALLDERLEALAAKVPFPAALTRDLHVLPDHHGNRSPRADPTLRGMISGLTLEDDLDALAVLYLATIQAIAHGTRHILEALAAQGFAIDTLVASGGDAKNAVFLTEHADITGCPIALPGTSDGVLLGAAILGAVAAGAHPSLVDAMHAMSRIAHVLPPADAEVRAYHERKHQVFLRMYEDQLAYRRLMGAP